MNDKKVVVVTGGSDGLGKSIAKQLSKDNIVVILSPTEAKLKKVAEEIGCEYRVCDVKNYKEVENAISEIKNKHGRIDVLINNAGLWIQDELDINDPAEIKEVLEVNSLGVMYVSKGVIPHMKEQKSGTIININSQGGFYAKAERAVYSMAKWGVTGFTKSLDGELAKYGIRVVGIYPGKMKTDMFKKMGIEKPMEDALDTEEVAKLIEFVVNSKQTTTFPELGIKFLGN